MVSSVLIEFMEYSRPELIFQFLSSSLYFRPKEIFAIPEIDSELLDPFSLKKYFDFFEWLRPLAL